MKGLGHVSERALMSLGRREGRILWGPGADVEEQLCILRRTALYRTLHAVQWGCYRYGFVCGAERAEAKAREGRT